MTTTRVTPSQCPNCTAKIDSASGELRPAENDLSVCFYCGGLLAYNKDLTVRIATQDELDDLKREDPVAWEMLIGYRDSIIALLGGIQ